ncbi:MAG: ABC transporter substrate-binding protein [Chloroflexi bacterium]|nr:ABC transporter substrate-binding protein [Chloroflexota bacterium]MBI3931515.1 ABC transporter substrate-binding protein [Chloroflexota bacterium]
MKKKVVWMVVGGWMVAALLVTACAPAVVEEEKVAPREEVVTPKEEVVPKEVVVPKEETNLVKWTGKKLDGTVVEKMIEKPKYGGAAVLYTSVDSDHWDTIGTFRLSGAYYAGGPVNETLLTRDWTRGPVGSEDWTAGVVIRGVAGTTEGGLLATKWELLGPDTLAFPIRQGVRWALDPTSEASRLVGGRELTAEDVVKSTARNWSVGYPKSAYPYLSDMKNPANSIYLSPDDPRTMVVKSTPGDIGQLFRMVPIGVNKIMAPEVWEKYGVGEKKEINNWRHLVGTGPFMLKDYVAASSYTYVRNPNYWMPDPFFPENQLPYLDSFKVLVIPDKSTMTAALRTGKISASQDTLGDLDFGLEEAQALWRTAPALKWTKHSGTGGGDIFLRVDAKPLDDVRVRRALMMAINFQEIKELYWQGDAIVFIEPIGPDLPWHYKPLEEMSPAVQELYGYHPDKAKQLLTEAGYPNGFKTEIILTAPYVDLLSLIKEYWAKIGVDLQLEVRDASVHRTIGARKTHTQMYQWTGGSGVVHVWASTYRTKGGGNYAMSPGVWHKVVWDSLIENYFDLEAQRAVLYDSMAPGMPGWVEHVTLQVYRIVLPQPYKYLFWQPWLKGFTGETTTTDTGHMSGMSYAWIDQELKQAMGR